MARGDEGPRPQPRQTFPRSSGPACTTGPERGKAGRLPPGRSGERRPRLQAAGFAERDDWHKLIHISPTS